MKLWDGNMKMCSYEFLKDEVERGGEGSGNQYVGVDG
jgi:hypothetical protein